MVRVAVQTLLKGVSGQRDANESYSQQPDFIPHVHVRGVQHNGLENTKWSRKRVSRVKINLI